MLRFFYHAPSGHKVYVDGSGVVRDLYDDTDIWPVTLVEMIESDDWFGYQSQTEMDTRH